MPAESIKVSPPELLASAHVSARALDKAAASAQGGIPSAVRGTSAADVAGAGVAAGISTLEGAFSVDSAAGGPALESTARVGVATLRGQDEDNAEALRVVAQEDKSRWA